MKKLSEFTDKYTSVTAAEKDKIVISNDAYAVGEMISKLMEAILRK